MTDEAIQVILKELHAERNLLPKHNELRNAKVFYLAFRDELVYVPEKRCWFYYRDGVWNQDVGAIYAMQCCNQLALQILAFAEQLEEETLRISCLRGAIRWQQRKTRETVVADARSEMALSFSAFDADPNLLNTQNGTIELDTVTFREHRAEDYLTKAVNAKYEPGLLDERFNLFIAEIMNDNAALCFYLQQCFGYAIAGTAEEECLFLLYGATTRNGKSTLTESVLGVLGDYGAAVSPDTVAMKRTNSSGPSEDLARLKGIRLAVVSEPESGLIFNASKIKTVTGRDTLTVRYLHENSFEYRPQFKLFINTNYLPGVTDMSVFRSGRLRVIPFTRHFAPEEQDKTLKDYFRTPRLRSVILNWLLDGYRFYKADGLTPPPEALEALKEYETNSDRLGRFVSECLIPAEGEAVPTAEVYAAYRQWCQDNGEMPLSKNHFSTRLKERGEIIVKRFGNKTSRCLLNYRLSDDCYRCYA